MTLLVSVSISMPMMIGSTLASTIMNVFCVLRAENSLSDSDGRQILMVLGQIIVFFLEQKIGFQRVENGPQRAGMVFSEQKMVLSEQKLSSSNSDEL